MNDELYYQLGQYCREYRMGVLHKTLDEISGDVNIKTLSAFEHGRSSNITHFLLYVNATEDEDIREEFVLGFMEILGVGQHGEI